MVRKAKVIESKRALPLQDSGETVEWRSVGRKSKSESEK